MHIPDPLRSDFSKRTPQMSVSDSGRNPLFWRISLLAWGIAAVIAFGVVWVFHLDFARAATITAFVLALALIITTSLRRIYDHLSYRFDITSGIFVCSTTLASALVFSTAWHAFTDLTGFHNRHFSGFEIWLLRVLTLWVIFLGWSFAYFWLKARGEVADQSAEAESARQEAHRIELQMLRAQLDPHFLFNSLNGIAAEVRTAPDNARTMIRELSDYLRYSLDHRKDVLGPLAAELTAMRAYLHVEKARFGERIEIEINATPEAEAKLVPTFLLQPLVENAVKHGLATCESTLKIIIATYCTGNLLHIEVTNSGHLDDSPEPDGGLGLETLQRRLTLHYPERHQFDLNLEGGQVRATLELLGEPCFG